MTITIIGTGYVGLVTGSVFADLGNKVFCVDISEKRIENLKKGQLPFYEPGLDDLVERNVSAGRLNFTTKYRESVPKSRIVFICVGTPPKTNGETDTSQLFSAVEETARNLSGYTLIAIKSTIPIGLEDDLEETAKKNSKAMFEFASCPEFLKEGTAIEDTINPDRIVVGTNSEKARKVLLEIHAPVSGQRILTDIRSAQLIKYASNSFLATKISYANAISVLCEKMNADVGKVIEGLGIDRRIGKRFLQPGVGYGGSCLPKDVLAFIHIAKKFGFDFGLLSEVDKINKNQIKNFIEKIKLANGNNLSGKTFAILGLSYKPNTDDLREAPAVKLIDYLLGEKAKIKAYDPQAMDNCKKIFPSLTYCKDPYETVKGVNGMLVLTEWNEFFALDLVRIRELMENPLIADGRNIFDPEKVTKLGFKYIGIGR